VEVIDSRNKVLLLSGAPHPDISALKSVLDEYEGSEVITSLYSEWNKSLDGVDLIIWHEPGINFDQNSLQLIKQKNIPIFFIIGPNTSSGAISKLNIGITVAAGNQTDENQAVKNKSFSAFELGGLQSLDVTCDQRVPESYHLHFRGSLPNLPQGLPSANQGQLLSVVLKLLEGKSEAHVRVGYRQSTMSLSYKQRTKKFYTLIS
jgi:hypothetical protein